MAGARDDWWVIGSCAVLLHGSDPGGIADVDLLLSEEDALRLLEPRGIAVGPGAPHPLFRSRLFARWDGTPVAAEFMAGFSLFEQGEWRPVLPSTRVRVEVEGASLFIPEKAELRAMLQRFGRGKDLQRAACL